MTSLVRQVRRKAERKGTRIPLPSRAPPWFIGVDGKHHQLHFTKGWRVTRNVNFDNEPTKLPLLEKLPTPSRKSLFKRVLNSITKPVRRWERNK